MGLFMYMKEAGAKLFDSKANAAAPDALKQEVQGHGIDAGKLNIHVQGDRVKLSGLALTQEEAEKIILAVGNIVGVAEVDTSDLKVQSPAARSTMYTVQKGDTFWKIAEMHCVPRSIMAGAKVWTPLITPHRFTLDQSAPSIIVFPGPSTTPDRSVVHHKGDLPERRVHLVLEPPNVLQVADIGRDRSNALGIAPSVLHNLRRCTI
jgi:hypothetical protein